MIFADALVRRWNACWFSAASPYPIATFRVLLALFLLGYLGALAPYVFFLHEDTPKRWGTRLATVYRRWRTRRAVAPAIR